MKTLNFTLSGILWTALISGCAQIPVAELTQYKQAFTQTQESSETVLLDYDQALKESRGFIQARSLAPASVQPYPLIWEDAAKELDGGIPDDIQARRLAFKVIGHYNAVLTQLAEGKSVEQVNAGAKGLLKSIDQLQTTLRGSGITGLVPITGIVTLLADLFEKARLREEFVRAVEKGAPVVEKLIGALIADIKSHYDLRTTLLNRERSRTIAAMRTAQETVSIIVSQRNVPSKEVDRFQTEVNNHLIVVRTALATYPVTVVSGGAGTLNYSAVDQAQVQDELKELGRLENIYKNNIQAADGVKAMLIEYRKLLDKMQAALAGLVRSLSAPVDLTAGTNELLDVAFGLKRHLEDLRAARASQ